MLQCYNITHQTSSPHHPRSNGFVERMVGVAKKLMDKAGRHQFANRQLLLINTARSLKFIEEYANRQSLI